jgi:glycine/D-amino acid oxidase-like deaminating enzyme
MTPSSQRANEAQLLVVGGGIIGLAIAEHCARRAQPGAVLLIERKTLGAGSSGRSGAILRQHYRDAVVAQMARDSLAEYAGFEARTGLPLGFVRSGVLTVAGPGQPEWCQRIRENVEMLRGLGIETELVNARRMRALVPGGEFAEGALGAWEPGAGFVDPLRTVEAFGELARQSGAEVRTGVELTGIECASGRVVGVRTSAGDVRCERIVIVAGPWTRRILAGLGIHLPLRVVRPENHYLGTTDARAASASAALHPVLIDLEHECYARCDPSQARTRTGRVDYDVDEELDDPDALVEEVSDELKRWARAALARRLPPYATRPDAGSIAAWYTLTPDAQALIGPVPGVAGLFVASGFSGHGFKLAPSVGKGLAQMLHGEPVTAFDPAFFDPARFRGGERWVGRFGL